jgi:hypothetical protein
MLIMSRDDAPIIAAAPEPLRPGPLPRRPQRLIDSSASFAGVYLRPHLSNGGAVPTTGPLGACPDIWIAHGTPVDHPEQMLANEPCYARNPTGHIESATSNHIHVRAFNNTGSTQTRQVSLYHAPPALIQWPALWRRNRLPTTQGDASASLVVPAQSVGVCDQAFVWADAPPVPSGNGPQGHHALIAQVNDAANSNPLPDIGRALDMAALVGQNLGWGWRNIGHVPASAGPSFTCTTMLAVPGAIAAPGSTFLIWVSPQHFTGWSVQFHGGQADSDGKPFTLGPHPVPITADHQIIGLMVTLEPGFEAQLSVTLHSNGRRPPPGASLSLMCSYQASGTHAEEAYARGLVDPLFMRAVTEGLRGTRQHLANTPTAYVGLGGITWATAAPATHLDAAA